MDFFEDLKTFECPPPDPSEFIGGSENATLSKLMMGNQNSKGYVRTPEERERRRQTMLGVKHTPERRKNMSLAKLGVKHSPERNAKKSQVSTGRKWFNDGKVNRFTYKCPDGFVPGMLKRK